jgi:hypothetical protein
MNDISPIKYKFKIAKTKLLAYFFPQKYIFQEALDCFKERLPKNVEVVWERDADGFIVGNINADGDKFMTQGKNAKDFIKMVNDAIYAVYDIPPEYISKLGGETKYYPKPSQLALLKDKSIKEASFGLTKQLQVA